MPQVLAAQDINTTLFDIFGINYAFDVQEFTDFYHVSVIKKDKSAILPDDYFPIYKRLTLIDSPVPVFDRLYFKISK